MQELKVITYNIWDLPLWFVKNRRARIESIARYLAGSGADIICVQESWDTANRPMFYEHMNKAGYFHESASEVNYLLGNAGLVTFSKFPITSKSFTPFSRLGTHVVEFFTARGILETIIETPAGLIRVFNTHLHMPAWFFDSTIRLAQLKRAFKAIDQKSDMPMILAGDFNEHELLRQKDFAAQFTSRKFTYPPLDKDFQPTYRVENPFVNGVWFNHNSYSKCFDYIFISQFEKFGLHPRDYHPICLDPVLSDHDPVFLSLAP
jgi:endonuclease/exonuclease/phosphatase family metal-dependent hydrolase